MVALWLVNLPPLDISGAFAGGDVLVAKKVIVAVGTAVVAGRVVLGGEAVSTLLGDGGDVVEAITIARGQCHCCRRSRVFRTRWWHRR